MDVLVLSCVFCCSVVLGNASLGYISVSLSEAVGALTPFFTVVFAYLLHSHTESLSSLGALVPVVAGCVIVTNVEPEFHALGLMCAFLATGARGLKTVLQESLLKNSTSSIHLDPVSLLQTMSFMSVWLLIPAVTLWEPDCITAVFRHAAESPHFLTALFLNCVLSVAVNLSNLVVTKYTNATTLQVFGNAKGVFGALLSVIVFKTPLTLLGAAGCIITVCGVYLYSFLRHYNQRTEVGTVQENEHKIANHKQTGANEDTFQAIHTAGGPICIAVLLDRSATPKCVEENCLSEVLLV